MQSTLIHGLTDTVMATSNVHKQVLPPGVTLFDPPHLSFSREQPDDALKSTLGQVPRLAPFTVSNIYIGKNSPTQF